MKKIRVLIVDDSVVFRSQIKAALEVSSEIEVAGSANNGKIAIQKLTQLSVDLITLDMEMPEMDGLQTIQEIKKQKIPVRILVFSSQTQRGSEAALRALSMGADDFLAKPNLDGKAIPLAANPSQEMAKELIPKILQFMPAAISESVKNNFTEKLNTTVKREKLSIHSFSPKIIVIGSSTGGPQALEQLLSTLKPPLKVPILIAQHIPPIFSASLAKRLQDKCGVECAEGKDMEDLLPNRIYVAPGDYHMTVNQVANSIKIILNKDPPRNSVRPAVDVLFESATKVFANKCMGIILTGMGEDGLQGCKAIKNANGFVAIQNKESCIVFGMPGAVYDNALYDEIGDLNQLGKFLLTKTVQ